MRKPGKVKGQDLICITQDEYQQIVRRLNKGELYEQQVVELASENQSLEQEVSRLRMQLHATPHEKRVLLCEQLNMVLNEEALLNDIRMQSLETDGKDLTAMEESLEQTIGFIREYLSDQQQIDEDLAYYRIRISNSGGDFLCPECLEEMDVTSRKKNSIFYYLHEKFCLQETTYYGLLCPSCGYRIKNRWAQDTPKGVISQSIIQPEVLSHVIMRKYLLHSSYLEQELLYDHIGVSINAFMLAQWVRECYQRHIQALRDQLWKEIKNHRIIYTDRVTVTLVRRDQKETLSYAEVQVYMTGADDDGQIVAFQIVDAEKPEFPPELTDYTGIVMTSDPEYHTAVMPEAVMAGSWEMVQGLFQEAYDDLLPSVKNGSAAEKGLEYCAKLFLSEEMIKDLPPDIKKMIRNELTREMVDEMVAWIMSSKTFQRDFTKKTKTAQAMEYVLRYEIPLRRFLDDGRLQTREEQLGKNLMRFSSDGWRLLSGTGGLDTEAGMLTVICSAEANALDPERYLTYYLQSRVRSTATEVEASMLPWNAPKECKKLFRSKVKKSEKILSPEDMSKNDLD